MLSICMHNVTAHFTIIFTAFFYMVERTATFIVQFFYRITNIENLLLHNAICKSKVHRQRFLRKRRKHAVDSVSIKVNQTVHVKQTSWFQNRSLFLRFHMLSLLLLFFSYVKFTNEAMCLEVIFTIQLAMVASVEYLLQPFSLKHYFQG